MLMQRHRRRPYPVTPQRPASRRLVSLVLLGIVLVIVAFKILQWFGVGNTQQLSAAILHVEPNGLVNVSVDDGGFKRAENGMKVYPGDAVVTTPRNYASLTLFDGGFVRLDEKTELTVRKSMRGSEKSLVALTLEEGNLWMATPPLASYSGSIVRTVETPILSIEIPSHAEVVIGRRSVLVYAADGPGLSVTVAGSSDPIVIGEGQVFSVPEGRESAADMYAFRNPITPDLLEPPFISESRAAFAGSTATKNPEAPAGDRPSTAVLTVVSPKDGFEARGATIDVSGTYGEGVENVRINGYLATLNASEHTFAQELTLPDEDAITITIEAVDSNGVVVSQAVRNVKRDRTPPKPPTIEGPAKSGQTFRTSSQEIKIEGRAPADAVGIMVNDYRLQLFKPGDADWSYLANTAFDNFKPGINVFSVVAINKGGYRSDPVELTVILGEGEEGVVTDPAADSSGGTARPAPPRTAEESKLPDNAPTMPGSVRVTAPAPGTEYTTDINDFLIEGIVPERTASVWVNGYKLQLYTAGKTFFNYIASTDLFTLKRGRNVYRIVARDAENKILDTVTYTVQFTPR
ncbi:hypothetical protein FJZ28_00335 [Candidatus Peregrinibacteria bacterium]|nr:hypothetical protein [Candidatus Peregrinibacteria bacterium]